MNDRIDDTRCVATKHVPRLRTNAASAKLRKTNDGKVRRADRQDCEARGPLRVGGFYICAGAPAVSGAALDLLRLHGDGHNSEQGAVKLALTATHPRSVM